MLKFCEQCENPLDIVLSDITYIYSCVACPYVQNINEEEIIIEINNSNDDIDIFDNDLEKYGSVCEKICGKCNNNKAAYYEMQTRSADEPMTVFYKCTKCENTWKE